MDHALHRNRTVPAEVLRRPLQQRLQRRLHLVHRVDIQQGVHRRSRPLDRRTALDREAFVDDLLQREQEGSLLDRIVAVDHEDVVARVDLQVQRPGTATADRIARHIELHLHVGTDIQRHVDGHPVADRGLRTPAPLEREFPPRHVIQRIGLLRLHEDHEIGIRDVRLARQRHHEARIPVRRGRNLHLHGPLAARNARHARGINLAVEEVVVLRRRMQHEHLLRYHVHVVGDVRQVLQVQVQIEATPVALRVEDRNVGGLETVVPHDKRRFGHRVAHARVVDRRAQVPHPDRPPEIRRTTLTLQDEIRRSNAPRRGDHARKQRVQ